MRSLAGCPSSVVFRRPDLLQIERVFVHVLIAFLCFGTLTVKKMVRNDILDFSGQTTFSDIGNVCQCICRELLIYFEC